MIDFDGNNKYARGLLEQKYIPTTVALQRVVSYLKFEGLGYADIVNELTDFVWGISLKDGITKDSLIKLAFENSPAALRGSFSDVTLYKTEIDYLRGIKDDDTRKILYMALVVSKWNDHPSGWIRYNKDDFFEAWGMEKSDKERKVIIKNTCQQGMDLRVVGSKNPVICFRVNFRFVDNNPVKKLTKEDDIKKSYYELFEVPA